MQMAGRLDPCPGRESFCVAAQSAREDGDLRLGARYWDRDVLLSWLGSAYRCIQPEGLTLAWNGYAFLWRFKP